MRDLRAATESISPPSAKWAPGRSLLDGAKQTGPANAPALTLPASLSPFHRDCVTEPARTGCGGTAPEPGEQLTCTLAGLCLHLSEAQAPTRTEGMTDAAHSRQKQSLLQRCITGLWPPKLL